MAYVLFNLGYQPELIAKDMDELNLKNPRWKIWQDKKAGHMVEISDSDFVLVQTAVKDVSYDGTTVSLIDRPHIAYSQNAEELQASIDLIIKKIDYFLLKYTNTSFGTELTNYKNNLQSIDTSSITYPMNVSIEQYLLNQNKSILGCLQIV